MSYMKIIKSLWIIVLLLALTLIVEAKKSHKAHKVNLEIKSNHHHNEGKGHNHDHHKHAHHKHAQHKDAHHKHAHHKHAHHKHGHHKHTHHKHAHHKHVHHKGIHHARPITTTPMPRPLIHSTTPAARYSPPFVGIDNGQIPHDDQVALILDYLAKIESTIDVFLRLQETYPDGSVEQRQLVRNVYPPIRVLLEAQHINEYSIKK